MGADLRDEVERLLNQVFPEPKEESFDLANGPTESVFAEALEKFSHLAVHVNDRRHRDFMRDQVTASLLCGGDLSAAERAWLIYVLRNLKDIPCECKNGHPINGDDEIVFKRKLAEFIINDESTNPSKKRGYVKARLNRAAGSLAKSYEVVRAAYYSQSFKTFLENLKKRRFNPAPDK